MLKRIMKQLTFWRAFFVLIMLAGAYATYVRFFRGLGATTNLSDSFPWGLWIGFDLLVGVGLAAGGFVTAATVHVFRIHKYEPIARPTVLTAFLGYLLVIVALLYDLGRPYRIWHPLVMWNPHSVMFEVAWCVMLYTTVLALEFSPLVLEKLGLHAPLKVMRRIYVPLVIVGCLLSTLHQSSLGTLYVIAPDKLHGIWYSPLLPVFFFVSSIAAGLAMTIFESFMSYRAFGKRLESSLLDGLGRVIVIVLAVYAALRLQDLGGRQQFGQVFMITEESVMFWGEFVLGVLLPMVLFAVPRVRRNSDGMFLASMLTILGFVINRLNVAITGMAGSSGVNYRPSWMEASVTMMVVALGFFAFRMAAKHLPLFEGGEAGAHEARPELAHRPRPAFHGGVVVTFWVLLGVGFALVTYAGKTEKNGAHAAPAPGSAAASFVAAEDASQLPPPYTFPQGEDSPGPVVFDHEAHWGGQGDRCATCHLKLFELNRSGQPLTGTLEYERIHEGDLCFSCHDGEKAFAVDEDCAYCHAE